MTRFKRSFVQFLVSECPAPGTALGPGIKLQTKQGRSPPGASFLGGGGRARNKTQVILIDSLDVPAASVSLFPQNAPRKQVLLFSPFHRDRFGEEMPLMAHGR